MGANVNTPPLPAGFTLDQPDSGVPPLPEGFTIDAEQTTAIETTGAQQGSQAEDDLMSSQMDALGQPNAIESQLLPDYVEPEKKEPFSFGRAVTGAPETALTLGTGMTGGAAGMGIGTVEGIIKEVASGNFGTKEAANRIEDLAMKRAAQLTFQPRTEVGKATLEHTAEALKPLESLPPILAPELMSARFGSMAPVIADKLNRSSLPSIQKANMGFKKDDLSAGAAQTPRGLERVTTAENMPVPFEGDSALTQGQATRNFEQLQFEKEASKLGDIGGPLRDRVDKQTATIVSNFDALADQTGGAPLEYRDLGGNVDRALISRFNHEKKKVDKLYEKAREEGELREKIVVDDAADMLSDLDRFENTAKNVKDIRREALKKQIVKEDAEGNLIPQERTLEEVEDFRAFINQATDITDPQQARMRRIAISAIDDSTENSGGDLFKRARAARSKMSKEFENVGITKRLLATKKGTDERSIAYEDVFKKVFLDSPIEEVNKLRSTLLKSGAQGKQAWSDMKAKGIDYIKENALSASQKDASGNPLLSPDKLNKTIKALDEKGKLDGIYGKRNAQALRDLGDLATDIYTAPPGAVNYSNTASALQIALDSLAVFAFTGIPAPIATTLSQGSKYIRDSKKRKRVNESINYLRVK